MNVLRHNHPGADGAPLTLISDWWLREHWGRAFEVLRIEPNIHNQSWALLRKRDVRLTVQQLEVPGDDPREYAALRHNLRQAQRELERARSPVSNAAARGVRAVAQLAAHAPTAERGDGSPRLPQPAPGEVAAGEAQRGRQLPPEAAGHQLELATVLDGPRVGLHLGGEGDRASDGRLGFAAPSAVAPASAGVAHARHLPVPFLGHGDVGLGPVVEIGGQLQRMVVDDLEIGGHDRAPRRADLQAEIEVVPMQQLPQRLVEADVLDHPRGQDEHESVDRVDLAEPGVGGLRSSRSRSREGTSPPPSSV